ncbi:MAG: ISKra4 family transposase, partial [Deltaproteobacteria bacterium]|nr:ISKra4 family transposase [Deltaproteobacteria bacterium]
RPELRVVGLADGAAEMQQMLDRIVADQDPVAVSLDFWHLTEKLGKAITATGRSAATNLSSWKAQLLSDDRAIERIETWLRTWTLDFDEAIPEPLHDALTYIENNRERMRYASLAEAGLPIGSGMVEATCKTLVSVRMKRCGCRWKAPSGQAILNLRSLACSSRWDRAMALLSVSYVQSVIPARRAA